VRAVSYQQFGGACTRVFGRVQKCNAEFNRDEWGYHMILQPSSCMLEGIVDGKPKIGVALVCGRSAADAAFAIRPLRTHS
jgi:hypothetical protein